MCKLDDQPTWHSYACGLARPAPVSGRVTDEAGHGLADAKVQLMHVVAGEDGRYESPDEYASQTEAVGKWSGSGNIDANNQISFADVPPGRYVLRGQPNPLAAYQQTESLTIDLKGGQTTNIKLSAK